MVNSRPRSTVIIFIFLSCHILFSVADVHSAPVHHSSPDYQSQPPLYQTPSVSSGTTQLPRQPVPATAVPDFRHSCSRSAGHDIPATPSPPTPRPPRRVPRHPVLCPYRAQSLPSPIACPPPQAAPAPRKRGVFFEFSPLPSAPVHQRLLRQQVTINSPNRTCARCGGSGGGGWCCGGGVPCAE